MKLKAFLSTTVLALGLCACVQDGFSQNSTISNQLYLQDSPNKTAYLHVDTACSWGSDLRSVLANKLSHAGYSLQNSQANANYIIDVYLGDCRVLEASNDNLKVGAGVGAAVGAAVGAINTDNGGKIALSSLAGAGAGALVAHGIAHKQYVASASVRVQQKSSRQADSARVQAVVEKANYSGAQVRSAIDEQIALQIVNALR